MMPENIFRWFGTELNDACKINVTADIHMKFRSSKDHRFWS